MPNPNQQDIQQNNRIPSSLLESLSKRQNPTGDNSNLSYEISELRKDIAQLRADLVPVPSLIATGKTVMDEFNRLIKDTK